MCRIGHPVRESAHTLLKQIPTPTMATTDGTQIYYTD
jgi:hypothetical protein